MGPVHPPSSDEGVNLYSVVAAAMMTSITLTSLNSFYSLGVKTILYKASKEQGMLLGLSATPPCFLSTHFLWEELRNTLF